MQIIYFDLYIVIEWRLVFEEVFNKRSTVVRCRDDFLVICISVVEFYLEIIYLFI